jgi:hypothetical protein
MSFPIVIVQECSAGNAEVGNMWVETKIFSSEDKLADIIEWKKKLPSGAGGRTLVTIPESDKTMLDRFKDKEKQETQPPIPGWSRSEIF